MMVLLFTFTFIIQILGTTTQDDKCTIPESTPETCVQDSDQHAPYLPNSTECGKFIARRILGGTKSTIYQHPWAALLEYTKPDDSKDFVCGGTLINNLYILTAAHCVVLRGSRSYWTLSSVRLGETVLESDPDCYFTACAPSPIDFAVSKTIVHENYDIKTRDNDIALVKLSNSVTFSDFIRPICLPQTEDELRDYYKDEFGEVFGWGMTENYTKSMEKLVVSLPIVENDNCTEIYEQANVTVTENQLCAGGEKGEDTCRGDSGGSITLTNEYNRYMAIGVVSYGRLPCGYENWPGIYTRVSKYMDWILENIKT